MDKEYKPREWKMKEWYEWYHQNHKYEKEAFPANVDVSPDKWRAREAGTLKFAITLQEDLEVGSHIALEMPTFWNVYLGRPFPAPIGIKKFLVARDSVIPGYGAAVWVYVQGGEELDFKICDASRFCVIDAVVNERKLSAGERILINIGDERGSLIQAQRYAQPVEFVCGIDPGDGQYRRIEPVPSVEVTGSTAEKLKIIAPTRIKCGSEFRVKVLAVDRYNENPATDYPQQVEIVKEKGPVTCSDKEVKIEESRGTVVCKSGDTKGIARIVASDTETAISGQSNPVEITDDCSERVYFGDIHAQSYVDLDYYYTWARDVSSLDFSATANTFARRHKLTDELWNQIIEKSNKYNTPGEFATFVSYEWCGNSGHKNVYYRGDTGPVFKDKRHYKFMKNPEVSCETPDELWKALDGWEAMTIPHHTKYINTTDWSYHHDGFQRLVEICNLWGISEEGGRYSVQEGLARGHKLGFIGGTDNHTPHPGTGTHLYNEGNGLSCVWAPELTREYIFDAMYNRHCYATMGNRTILKFRIGNSFMGEETEVEYGREKPREIEVEVAGERKIAKIEIIRNNNVTFESSESSFDVKRCFTDRTSLEKIKEETRIPFVFYYARVTEIDGRKSWASPIWFTEY